MRLNENAKIIGQEVILIPYEAKHVEKYHRWMQDEKLQQLTASEPLTLQEEYAMQRSWREDEDKCTFLVMCRQTYEAEEDQSDAEIKSLVGDTNLFLHHESEDNGSESLVAEAEIMIAEPSARGKGKGWEAMLLLLKYGQLHLNIKKFEVKIGIENIKSLRMFEKMQFNEVTRSEVFQEVTMERPVTKDWVEWLDKQVSLDCKEYK